MGRNSLWMYHGEDRMFKNEVCTVICSLVTVYLSSYWSVSTIVPEQPFSKQTMDLFQPASESQSDEQNTTEFCITTQLSYNELSDKPQKDNCITEYILSVSTANPPPLTTLLPKRNVTNSSQTVETSKYTASPAERDKIWTFPLTQSVMHLRTLCKNNGLVQKGRNMNQELVCSAKLVIVLTQITYGKALRWNWAMSKKLSRIFTTSA